MDFEASLQYMESLLRFGWKLGNERFSALCERLDNPQDQYRVIHITGTKGKGSTTALAANVLRAQGYNVGAYFSPYVYDPCERVQVNGQMIPRGDFARIVTRIRPHIEELAQTELGQTTEFELKTALGFCWFAEQKVDYACIEVGIGGRLDATNIVKPTVSVITNIGLDHTQQLGDTHALIAGEKAGIIKPGIPCITAAEHPDALEVIRHTARERNSPLALVRQGEASQPTGDRGQIRWRLDSTDEHVAPFTVATASTVYPFLQLQLNGVYQRVNAACAVAAVETALQSRGDALTQQAVMQGLRNTTLPGRFEQVQILGGPLVVLDGAHNEMAAQALTGPVRALRAAKHVSRVFLVIGMLTGHDPKGVFAALAPLAERIYVCQPQWKRAQPVEELANVARQFASHVVVIPDVAEAAQAAIEAAQPNDLVLITGSFYTVGETAQANWKNLHEGVCGCL